MPGSGPNVFGRKAGLVAVAAGRAEGVARDEHARARESGRR